MPRTWNLNRADEVFRAVLTETHPDGRVTRRSLGPYTGSGPARRAVTDAQREFWTRRRGITVAGVVERAELIWEALPERR